MAVNRVFASGDVGLCASGGDEVVDWPVAEPDDDGFVVAVKRANGKLAFGWLQVMLVAPGEAESDGPAGEGETASTLRAWLTVEGVRYDAGEDDELSFPISEELVLCDHNAGDAYFVGSARDILELTSEGLNTLQAGDKVRIVYHESGDTGEYTDHTPVGLRPQIQILSWPLVAVEE